MQKEGKVRVGEGASERAMHRAVRDGCRHAVGAGGPPLLASLAKQETKQQALAVATDETREGKRGRGRNGSAKGPASHKRVAQGEKEGDRVNWDSKRAQGRKARLVQGRSFLLGWCGWWSAVRGCVRSAPGRPSRGVPNTAPNSGMWQEQKAGRKRRKAMRSKAVRPPRPLRHVCCTPPASPSVPDCARRSDLLLAHERWLFVVGFWCRRPSIICIVPPLLSLDHSVSASASFCSLASLHHLDARVLGSWPDHKTKTPPLFSAPSSIALPAQPAFSRSTSATSQRGRRHALALHPGLSLARRPQAPLSLTHRTLLISRRSRLTQLRPDSLCPWLSGAAAPSCFSQPILRPSVDPSIRLLWRPCCSSLSSIFHLNRPASRPQ